jgi:hypothetical protein
MKRLEGMTQKELEAYIAERTTWHPATKSRAILDAQRLPRLSDDEVKETLNAIRKRNLN